MKYYRFQTINKLTLQNLTNQKNWIADPLEFNDPHEFSFFDNVHMDETGDMRILTTEEIANVTKFQNTIKDFGVVCYSTEYNNNLLWAHYGDNHKGMCLVFDIQKEKQDKIHKVVYQERFPLINYADDANTRDEILKIVTTKSIDWKYEKEYRQVFVKKNIMHDYPGKLVEIIFGSRTPFEDIKMVANIAISKNKEILISRMHLSNNQYSLGKLQLGDNKKIPDFWKESFKI